MTGGLPAVAIHDLVIHEGTGDLIVGTHGRSLYKANVKLLRTAATDNQLAIDAPETARYSGRYGGKNFDLETVEPEYNFSVYYPGQPTRGELMISTEDGTAIYRRNLDLVHGVNEFTYNQSFERRFTDKIADQLTKAQEEDRGPVKVEAADNATYYLRPGTYQLKVVTPDNSISHTLEVK